MRRIRLRVLLPVLLAFAVSIAVAMTGAATSGAAFGTPSQFVQFTLEGCIQDGTIEFPTANPAGSPAGFVCPDAQYTTGNQQKLWNELDLVPYRLTTSLGNQANATTTYSVVIAGDSLDQGGDLGYDVMTAPVINTALSHASCSVVVDPAFVGPPLTGGAAESIARVLTITQNKGTTCVLDWTNRIGLGAHNFAGSSLQSYLFQTSDFTGSKKTVPLPVSESEPQELSKDMTAVQNTNTPWNLTKSATPNTLSFGNVCAPGYTGSTNVGVTITWTKLAPVPSGMVQITTNIYASNPSARSITTTVSDQIYAGAGQGSPIGVPFVATDDVPGNTDGHLMGTHTITVPASAVTEYNDVATATYVDTLTGIAIPGSVTASASSGIGTGTNTNGSATITDTESITGSGLAFSTGLPSPVAGSFTGVTPYVAGTSTTGPVNWSSGLQSDSGATTFAKTVTLDPKQVTSGTLSDTATLNGSDGFGPVTASLNVGIVSTATTTLTINKTIPNVLQGAETVTFTFHVGGQTATITFVAGETSKSTTVNLAPGNYTVTEDALTGWTTDSSKSVDLTLPANCTNSVTFANTVPPATATARKVTQPAGGQAGWTFTLTRPNGTTSALVTDANGNIDFGNLTAEGQYTIVETPKPGYEQVGISGCTFTVNFPADAGRAYACTITNRADATLRIVKVTDPANSGLDSFSYLGGGTGVPANFDLDTNGVSATPSSRTFTFSGAAANFGAKTVSEVATTGWTLTNVDCGAATDSDASLAGISVDVQPGDSVVCTYTNKKDATLTIVKTTNPVNSGTSNFGFLSPALGPFTLDTNGADATYLNQKVFTFAGTGYGVKSVSETNPTPWTLESATCTGGTDTSALVAVVTVDVQPGANIVCTYHNQMRARASVTKTVNGNPLAEGQTFVFQLRQGASAPVPPNDPGSIGTILDTQVVSLGNGTLDFNYPIVPGQDYQLCELLVAEFGPAWPAGFGPFNPDNQANVLCINFNISLAEAVLLGVLSRNFTVDNSHSTTSALTIGYWKNHAPSCKKSGGNQDDDLTPALGAGFLLGTYLLTDPCKAIHLLSKSNINGVKKPGDAIFNMVAQLVAAKLNLNNDAGGCAPLTAAITAADALLVEVNFNGITHDALTAQEQIDATTLNGILDSYNNNNLC